MKLAAEPEVEVEVEVDVAKEADIAESEVESVEPQADESRRLLVEDTPMENAEHEHYEQIKSLAAKVAHARINWKTAKDEASESKKLLDALQGDLVSLIRRGPDLQRRLPLSDESPIEAAVAVVQEMTAWRDVEVGELNISDAMANKLIENGLSTLGELSGFWKAGKVLTEIKGIGGAKADLIADAFAEYGTAHPELYGQAAEGLAANSDSDAEQGNEAEGDWDIDEDE